MMILSAFGLAFANGKAKSAVRKSNREWYYKQRMENKERYAREKKELYDKYATDDKKALGDAYEAHVGKLFEERGYIVKYQGLEKGREDGGIDLIAVNKSEAVFIQCKNWARAGKKINMHMVKAFSTDVSDYIEENPTFRDYEVQKIYAISNPILDKAAYAYIQKAKDFEYLIIRL